MTCLREKPHLQNKAAQYATSEDFRRVFADDVDSLYQLSFLLAGDHASAERCFVAGLEDSVRANSVFKEWAHTWAKRTVIQQAIRAVQPKPPRRANPVVAESRTKRDGLPNIPDRQAIIDRLQLLDDFDRFVFVMSVLERYSVHDCALLLDCSLLDVREARIRALQQITSTRRGSRTTDLFDDAIAVGSGGERHA